MIPGHYERVKEIFLRVADLPEEDRRAALRAACGTNASLRAEVEDLLALDSEPFSGSEDTGDKITHTIGTLNPQARIGPYLIGDELGSGGMGKVYRAEVVGKAPGLAAGTTVALKIIHPHLLEKAGFFKRFLREAEIGKSVRHPNVVRCIDCDAIVHEGRQLNFLVMEYVEGQTLRSLLQELDRVPEELCRHLGREIARGLAAIHAAGVVHRDLKPDNILITADHAVKVMDLGVARPTEQTARLSQTGSFIGTVEYAAPEQFRSDGPDIDGRADLYALGIILYELSTARHPYRDGDPRVVLRRVLEEPPRRVGQLNPQLSPFFEEVVQKLIAKDKEDRFASATDLIHVLEDGDKSEWWNARAQAIRIETKRPLRRVRMPRETAIYGREDDLARLRVIFADVKAAHGQVLLVEGEAGIGKTRLIDEFIGELDSAGEDLNFLFGSYPPGGAATVSGAWSTAYREQFGSEGLEERIRGYLSLTPSLASAFAALLKGEPTPEGKEPLTKDSMQTAFVQATRALAAERPTVVLIEDLHFAPEEGRAMFASLALAIPEDRVLLIGTSRPGVPESWRASIERLEHARSMALSRLGPKDLTRLLVDAFRSESLAEELAYKIAAKSDGNPFFAFEIVRDLREGQYLRMLPDGTWVISKKIQKIEIPSSVLDLVKARVSSLSEQERDLLDTASCCGFSFDPLLVAEATGLPTLAVLKLLSQIERHHRLVRSSGSNYVFDHHQVQEALYGSLSQPLRQAYHASIGEALEIRGSEDVTAVCEHFLKGGRGERALPHLEPALRRLEQSFSSERALDLIEMALGCRGLLSGARRIEILLRKAERLDLLQHPDRERAALDEALDVSKDAGDPQLEAQVLISLGHHLARIGARDESVAFLSRGREWLASLTLPWFVYGEGAFSSVPVTEDELISTGRFEGHATYFGPCTVEISHRYNMATGHFSEGVGTCTARDGAQIRLAYTGEMTLMTPDHYESRAFSTAVEGTGRFEGVDGRFEVKCWGNRPGNTSITPSKGSFTAAGSCRFAPLDRTAGGRSDQDGDRQVRRS